MNHLCQPMSRRWSSKDATDAKTRRIARLRVLHEDIGARVASKLKQARLIKPTFPLEFDATFGGRYRAIAPRPAPPPTSASNIPRKACYVHYGPVTAPEAKTLPIARLVLPEPTHTSTAGQSETIYCPRPKKNLPNSWQIDFVESVQVHAARAASPPMKVEEDIKMEDDEEFEECPCCPIDDSGYESTIFERGESTPSDQLLGKLDSAS